MGSAHVSERDSQLYRQPTETINISVRSLKEVMKSAHITAVLGSSFNVELPGVPTAGYQWRLDGQPSLSVLERVESGLGGRMGGLATQTFIFTARNIGTEVLKFVESRSWEDVIQNEFYVRVSVTRS